MTIFTNSFLTCCLAACSVLQLHAADLPIKITKRYLNLPVSQAQQRSNMKFTVGGKKEREFKIRLASGQPEYWVFCDVSNLKAKPLPSVTKVTMQGSQKFTRMIKLPGRIPCIMKKTARSFTSPHAAAG